MTAVTAAEDRMRVLVEQSVARGETLDEICDRLEVDPRVVDKVLHRMDVINRDRDVIGSGRTTASTAALEPPAPQRGA